MYNINNKLFKMTIIIIKLWRLTGLMDSWSIDRTTDMHDTEILYFYELGTDVLNFISPKKSFSSS